ncbi:MAG: GntR family transcriptional regulator [Solirubrobacterales bacterium]
MTSQIDTVEQNQQNSANLILGRISTTLLVAVALLLASFAACASGASASTSTASPTHPYTVISGESVSLIADRCHTTVDRILVLNRDRIKKPRLIYPGQKLRLAKRSLWSVRHGETLTQVSECTGFSVAQIARRNSIADPHWIDVDERLVLSSPKRPAAEQSQRTTAWAQPAATQPRPAPTAQDLPQASPQRVLSAGSVRRSRPPWLAAALGLGLFALALFAGPLADAIRGLGSAAAPDSFVALATCSNPDPQQVVFDLLLFQRVAESAMAAKGVRGVGRVRLGRAGEAIVCLVPVEIDQARDRTEVAVLCARAVIEASPVLGEVTVGLEGAVEGRSSEVGVAKPAYGAAPRGVEADRRPRSPTPRTRTTKPDQVVERLAAMIDDQGLRPGTKLPPIDQLAATFEVSRGTLREALRELEGRGVVHVVRSRGTYVGAPASPPAADRVRRFK